MMNRTTGDAGFFEQLQRHHPAEATPRYVVTIPAVVASESNGSTSTGTARRSFPKEHYQRPHKYFRIDVNTRGKAINARKYSGSDAGDDGLSSSDREHQALVDKYANEAFAETSEQSRQEAYRMALVIGYNRMYSISKRKNQQLRRKVARANAGSIRNRAMGLFWKP